MKQYHRNVVANTLRPIFLVLFFLATFNITQGQTVRINEIMPANKSILADTDGKYYDWIELYNPTSNPIIIENWSLSDNEENSTLWRFPATIIKSKEYLVVFASGNDTVVNGHLHTNFKLSADGEFLGLYNPAGQLISGFSPSFPSIPEGQSYGDYKGNFVIFEKPTPGATNETSTEFQLSPPSFSVEHGFFAQPFQVKLNSEIDNSIIYFTTDASEPSATNGSVFKSPLTITKTTILRAVAVLPTGQSSTTSTQTYLFTNDIIRQSNIPEGYPSTWGDFASIKGKVPADYEMDQELLADPTMAERVKQALSSLPVISLASNKNNFFSNENNAQTGGIYAFTGSTSNSTGLGWERPVSVEYFDANDSGSFQINCGIELHGGQSRVPEKSPKHSFRLAFKNEYGPTRLKYPLFGSDVTSNFNNLILRSGYNNTWIHWSGEERERATCGRDPWSKDTQREMGHLTSHFSMAHLFINGIYWGIYFPSERLDENYGATYLGGNPEDYDVLKDDANDIMSGNGTAWKKMISMANAGLEDNEKYQKLLGRNTDGTRNMNYEVMVDADNLIDYMIINLYGGNTDWDHHNWAAMRNRVAADIGFRFFCWDQENVLKTTSENNVNEFNANCPSNIFQRMMMNDEFKRRFADRVLMYCTEDGILTTKSNQERWSLRSSVIEEAIDAEAARWGDYRRDVHPYKDGIYKVYTKDDWVTNNDWIMNTYFEQRTTIFLSQLKKAEMFPSTTAPVFYINAKKIIEKTIVPGDKLTMTVNSGTIYYTLDGTDPVDWSISSTPGETNLTASTMKFSGPIEITGSAHVNARTFYNNTWSAMRSQILILPEDYNNLKITEISYHPIPSETISDDALEFVELKNTGTTTINLDGLKFSEGIKYNFSSNTEIKPNGFIVLASDAKSFYKYYNFAPSDVFAGQLDNKSDELVLLSPAGDTICAITYKDGDGWPKLADGKGRTLVPTSKNPTDDQKQYDDWRASFADGGSPGADDQGSTTEIEAVALLPSKVILEQNYPNPFSEQTLIDFQLPEDSRVFLGVYNLNGQLIDVMVDRTLPKGLHQTTWSGISENGKTLNNGIYLYRLVVSGNNHSETATKKMVLYR